MQLVFVALRRGTPLHIADVSSFVGHDQRPFELAGSGRVDPEISAQLHRAAHSLGNVTKRTVRENGRIQRGEEIVGVRNHAAHVLTHQLGIVPQRFRERTENDSFFGQRFAERRFDRHGVHHRVDRHARHQHLFFERHAELIERRLQLRIDFVHTGQFRFLLRRGIINNILKIDLGQIQMRPARHRHRQPVPVSLQPEFGHPLRLAFFGRDHPDDLLAQSFGNGFGIDVGHKTVLILTVGDFVQYIVFLFHPT